MVKYLLPCNGNFYKANLHMHTTISDGRMTPEEVKEVYKSAGYSIVAYTDHEALVPHNDLTDDEFLAITSCEVSIAPVGTNITFPFIQCYHLNLYALDKDKDVYPVFEKKVVWPPNALEHMTEEQFKVDWHREYNNERMNELIAAANDAGFFISYNHPNWSLQSYEDYAELKGLWGVEWFNTGAVKTGFPDTMQPIDDLLKKGELVYPLAGDDSHDGKNSLDTCFGGFAMVRAEKLEYSCVTKALLDGDFYTSTGPEINELYLEDGVLHIKSSPVAVIDLITERRVRFHVEKTDVTEASFDLRAYFKELENVPFEHNTPYFRLTLTDANGKSAQTRAYTAKDWDN